MEDDASFSLFVYVFDTNFSIFFVKSLVKDSGKYDYLPNLFKVISNILGIMQKYEFLDFDIFFAY
jgi:hypothetical protein